MSAESTISRVDGLGDPLPLDIPNHRLRQEVTELRADNAALVATVDRVARLADRMPVKWADAVLRELGESL